MKRSWVKWIEWVLVVALVVMAGYGIWVGVDKKIAAKSIAKLDVLPNQVELAVGESVQLTVVGYLKDGSLADPKTVAKVDYHLEERSVDGAIVMDRATGVVTALAPGEGSVNLYRKDFNIGIDGWCDIKVVE